MAERFTGTGVALVTPFHSDKSIDYQSLENIINHVIEGGVNFIVALGTTGESATLSAEEKKQVIEQIVKFTKSRVPVVAGVGGNNTAEVLAGIQSADFNGIDAILSVVPYYNKPTQKGLYEHFSAIAAASPVPVILYNVPGRTSANLDAETTIHLASNHKNIIAIKEASGNFKLIMKLIHEKPANLQVLSGDDAITLSMIQLGGSGVISVLANSHPRHFSDMVKYALDKNYDKATNLHYQLLDYYDALFEEGNPAGVKAAMEIMGLCNRDVRLPLVSASDALSDKIKEILNDL
ncbi:MAG: 4-hydroxy-tetrahydrodipicolinate synthase [Bacteroidales bacterium]|jgi:4-hydroxy-tetrahydrodipicolinate synthase